MNRQTGEGRAGTAVTLGREDRRPGGREVTLPTEAHSIQNPTHIPEKILTILTNLEVTGPVLCHKSRTVNKHKPLLQNISFHLASRKIHMNLKSWRTNKKQLT